MRTPDRLTGLDSSFLHLERGAAHMHVAGCMVLEGPAAPYDELVREIRRRLHLVPRYRQRLAFVPLQQGRPVWVDDPRFNIAYHVRHAALPAPGDDRQLKQLAGRLFSEPLDRSRPLWEMWLVEGLSGNRFALFSKSHHALVDGISGVEIATVLFDASPAPLPIPEAETEWVPRPLPSSAQLLADALVERATVPGEIVRGARAALRGPRRAAGRAQEALIGVGALAWAGIRAAPPSPFNVRIGPHRRFTWVQDDLDRFRAIKSALGGTVNDVVLAVVAGALGRYMRLHGDSTELTLRALVPVSIRADVERGALGNRIAPTWAPLPVGVADPVQRLRAVSGAMRNVKESGQAVAARALTELAGFAPPTIVAQAARLQTRQRLFNLVVTNVPGPQTPLYLLGRKLQTIYPMVPLAENTAIGIAVMSYNGGLGFGVVGDYDVLEDLERVADAIRVSIEELVAAAARTGRAGAAGPFAAGAEIAPGEGDRPPVGAIPSRS